MNIFRNLAARIDKLHYYRPTDSATIRLNHIIGNKGQTLTADVFKQHGFEVEDVSRKTGGYGDVQLTKGNKKWLVEVKTMYERCMDQETTRHSRVQISKSAHMNLMTNAKALDATPVYVMHIISEDAIVDQKSPNATQLPDGRYVDWTQTQMLYLPPREVGAALARSKGKDEVKIPWKGANYPNEMKRLEQQYYHGKLSKSQYNASVQQLDAQAVKAQPFSAAYLGEN